MIYDLRLYIRHLAFYILHLIDGSSPLYMQQLYSPDLDRINISRFDSIQFKFNSRFGYHSSTMYIWPFPMWTSGLLLLILLILLPTSQHLQMPRLSRKTPLRLRRVSGREFLPTPSAPFFINCVCAFHRSCTTCIIRKRKGQGVL